jgi:hypothetical protein
MVSLRATMIGRALGVCTAQQLSLVGNSIWRRISGITNHVRGSPEETYGDDIEAVMLGMMLSWTPCVLLMAYPLWRAPLELD